MDRSQREMPTREVLRKFAAQIPEISVSAVEVSLQILEDWAEIEHYIFDNLKKNHNISPGKLIVMIILYQSPEGITPSKLAEKACVTRATISMMLGRMIRDGLAYPGIDRDDGRGKYISLTEKGYNFMDEILPNYFLRTSQLMSNLTEEEQNLFVRLLKKSLKTYESE